MAKLTRMQKYSDYREQMANDSEATTVSDDLNKFQNELNKVKTFTSPEIENIIAEKPEEKTQSEIAAEVIEELNNENPIDNDSDSVLKALDEIINGVTFDDTAVKEIIEEIPCDVEVISADSMADEMETTAIEKEETYRDEINSIIDELMGITDLRAPDITASLFDGNVSGDTDVSIDEIKSEEEEPSLPETELKVEEEPVRVSSFVIPVVKKNDKNESEIYAQICECSENIAEVVDSERKHYGVPAPVMWVAPVKVVEEETIVDEAEPITIDEVLSGLLESSKEEDPEEIVIDFANMIDDETSTVYEVKSLTDDTKALEVETSDSVVVKTLEPVIENIEVSETIEPLKEEIHCVSFDMPSVKKNDKTDAQILAQIDDCVKDFEMTIDSERIILGIPTPMMWIPPVAEIKEEKVTEATTDSTVDDIFSMFDTIEQEINKTDIKDEEISIEDIMIPEEITAAVNELEAFSNEAETVKEVKEEETTEETKDTPAEEKVEVKVIDPIPEITIPENDPILNDDDDDITLTNEISINYISDALSEAESFSAKEGLKTVEDITTTIIREVDKNDEKLEHPVAVAVAEGDTEVIEIRNFSELAEEDREAVLDDTIPFVIDKKMKKEDEAVTSNDEEEDFIPNKILNIVLIALIAVLLLVLGVVIYYIFLAQGLL